MNDVAFGVSRQNEAGNQGPMGWILHPSSWNSGRFKKNRIHGFHLVAPTFLGPFKRVLRDSDPCDRHLLDQYGARGLAATINGVSTNSHDLTKHVF